MNLFKLLTSGLGRVLKFPSLIFWVYMSSLVLGIPLAASIAETLKESIGSSLVHETLRQRFDLDWYGEFHFNHKGLAESFGPSVLGVLPTLTHLEKLLDGKILQGHPSIVLTGIIFLLVWAFLAGGILDRLARCDELHLRSRFFSCGGEYFFRLVRLLTLSLLLYWAFFRWLVNPIHTWLERATRDVTAEGTVLFYTSLIYFLVGLTLLFMSMMLDYAKIAMVVECRHSVLLSFVRGLRFLLSHPTQSIALYLVLWLVGILLFILYSLVAPGAGQSTWISILVAFSLGQIYLVARMTLKLWFLASQTVLFQSEQLVLGSKMPTAAETPEGSISG